MVLAADIRIAPSGLRDAALGSAPRDLSIHFKGSTQMRELIQLAVDRWNQRDERGQTLVEYGLLLALIAIVVIAVLIVLGPAVSGIFRSVNNQL
jgi:pilus assembly protein Flp/PilA